LPSELLVRTYSAVFVIVESMHLFCAVLLILAALGPCQALSVTSSKLMRRIAAGAMGVSLSISTFGSLSPGDSLIQQITTHVAVANALNYDENGEWIKPVEKSWQEVWGDRAAKASTMSQDEIFLAAKGAGNRPKDGAEKETPKARKRRAMAACRITSVVSKVSGLTERDCIIRVNDGGEPSFILDILDQQFQQK
jgi:hypothetical protein